MTGCTPDDPLHGPSRPDSIWSTTNVGEAMPGVPTPLCWTAWAPAAELSVRRAFARLGALERSEVRVPDRPEDRLIGIFHGQPAIRGEFMCSMGDRIPGTSGAAVAEQIFGDFGAAWEGRPSRRHYPRVAARIPVSFAQSPRGVRRARAVTEQAWSTMIPRLKDASTDEAAAAVLDGAQLFIDTMSAHVFTLFAGIQPVFDLVHRMTATNPGIRARLLAGYGGHEELELVEDLWACSRDRLTVDAFVARHGYHGPDEGELSNRTWREDPRPVHDLVKRYRGRNESARPDTAAQARRHQRVEAEAEFLASLSPPRRAAGRTLLGMARHYLPLRGFGKVAFLQALDVTRAAARRLGTRLHEDGVLDDPDDVFYLTVEEIRSRQWASSRSLVEYRRERRVYHRGFEMPVAWHGTPEPVAVQHRAAPTGITTVTGLGVSGGVVEGLARVVTDPADCDIDDGDILVAHTTDPSWVTLMFLSAALVVDVGGPLSHTAVVAREMGIPCVANTKTATATLRTGDLCRVDGTAGTVEVLRRAGDPAPTSTPPAAPEASRA